MSGALQLDYFNNPESNFTDLLSKNMESIEFTEDRLAIIKSTFTDFFQSNNQGEVLVILAIILITHKEDLHMTMSNPC